jgi:Rod binding domain-containing protein
MQIDTNSLINMDNIKTSSSNVDKFKNIDSSKLEDKELRKVTDDFESFFMQQLLDISLKHTKFAGEGSGSDIIKGMYTEAIAKESSGTVGISDLLYNFLSERNK